MRNADSLIKIGRTSRFRSRYKQLCHEYAQKLEILGILPEDKFPEPHLHRVFASLRVSGEWFIPNRQLYDFIAKHAKPWREEYDLPGSEKVVRVDRHVHFQLEMVARARGVSTEALVDDLLRDIAKQLYEAEARLPIPS